MRAVSKTIELATQWYKNDPNPITASTVQDLVERSTSTDHQNEHGAYEAEKELSSLFPSDGRRISFGTAGLRAAMKPGPLGMNDLTIVQTAQGLAKYCLKQQQQHQDDETTKKKDKICAVVGYDHRANPALNISSLSFAILTALVFAEAGIDCILLDGYVLTPLVPFVLQRVGAVAGIMVTASHNPKLDNGYKVYAHDGCQIRSPMDKEISEEILHNLEPWTDYSKLIEARRDEADANDACLGLSRPGTTRDMLQAYYDALAGSGLKTGQAHVTSTNEESLPTPSFAYTAMHGVGHKFVTKVFETFDLPPFKPVPSQCDPDPTFPTVPFPNPEEKGALDIAKSFAEEHSCDIVLANDPDADRLAIAERDRSSGQWTVFTGDQIGSMLGLWLWNQIGKNCNKPVSMCASTVSSKMLAEIARVEGFHFEDTLTGFKWIGSRSTALSAEGYRHLFGYEEAIGFACGDVIFDKDGVSAMAVFCEMTLWVYRQGRNLKSHMQSLYDTYGEFVSYNGYYYMDDASVVPKIMSRIRADGKYDVDVTPYKISSIRDLGDPGYDSSTVDNKPTLPVSKSSPMITIGFTNGCVAQFRASGTEPKFKYYIEMKGEPGVSRDTVANDLKSMAEFILERFLQPQENGLRASK